MVEAFYADTAWDATLPDDHFRRLTSLSLSPLPLSLSLSLSLSLRARARVNVCVDVACNI